MEPWFSEEGTRQLDQEEVRGLEIHVANKEFRRNPIHDADRAFKKPLGRAALGVHGLRRFGGERYYRLELRAPQGFREVLCTSVFLEGAVCVVDWISAELFVCNVDFKPADFFLVELPDSLF